MGGGEGGWGVGGEQAKGRGPEKQANSTLSISRRRRGRHSCLHAPSSCPLRAPPPGRGEPAARPRRQPEPAGHCSVRTVPRRRQPPADPSSLRPPPPRPPLARPRRPRPARAAWPRARGDGRRPPRPPPARPRRRPRWWWRPRSRLLPRAARPNPHPRSPPWSGPCRWRYVFYTLGVCERRAAPCARLARQGQSLKVARAHLPGQGGRAGVGGEWRKHKKCPRPWSERPGPRSPQAPATLLPTLIRPGPRRLSQPGPWRRKTVACRGWTPLNWSRVSFLPPPRAAPRSGPRPLTDPSRLTPSPLPATAGLLARPCEPAA